MKPVNDTLLVLLVIGVALATRPPPPPAQNDGLPSLPDFLPQPPSGSDVNDILAGIFGGGSNSEANA